MNMVVLLPYSQTVSVQSHEFPHVARCTETRGTPEGGTRFEIRISPSAARLAPPAFPEK